MGNYLSQNFEVKPDTTSVEALTRWRNVFAVVKDKKRRFRFTADLSKRHKVAALRIAQEGLLEDVETTEDHAIDMDLDHNPNPLPVGLELEREPSSLEPSYVNDTKRLVHTAANNMRKMICCKVFYMWLIRLLNVILEIIIAFLTQVNANGKISDTKYRKLSVITSSICLIMSLVEIMNYRLSQGKLFGELSLYFSVISSTLQFSINLVVLILKKQFIKFDYFSLLFSTVTLFSPMAHRPQEPEQEIHDA